MPYKVIFQEEALEDAFQAACWYEKKQQGLGQRFLDVIEKSSNRLIHTAFKHPKVRGKARKMVLPSFPYCLYYVETTELIKIVAIFQQSQGPLNLIKRF